MARRYYYRCPASNSSVHFVCRENSLWIQIAEVGTLFGCKRPSLVKSLNLLALSGQVDPMVDVFPSGSPFDDGPLSLSLRATLALGFFINRSRTMALLGWANAASTQTNLK
jgi:hypothetical protein